MKATVYNRRFYEGQADTSKQSADVVVPILLELVNPEHVVDVGCGVGTWLAAFADAGIQDYVGYDGDYVNRDQLMIPPEHFQVVDLATPPTTVPDQRFDLALCLEVAEHLPATSAEPLVAYLSRLAPVVFFSAAVPGQGGAYHVNEQWPEYWRDLFGTYEYELLDIIRPQIWYNSSVVSWYRQNAFLYVHKSRVASFRDRAALDASQLRLPLSVIHPDLFSAYADLARLSGRRMFTELLRRVTTRTLRKSE